MVLHFFVDPRVGGPHTYLLNLLPHLRIKGVRSRIVTAGRSAIGHIHLRNFRHFTRVLYLLEIIFNVIVLCAKLWDSKVRRQQLVFHVHGVLNVAPIAVASLMKIPTVWHIHESSASFRYFAKLGMLLLRRTHHEVVSVAESSRVAYSLPMATVIPSPVDTHWWHTRNENGTAKECNDPELAWTAGGPRINPRAGHPLRILTVANINPLKGLDLLLAALDRVSMPFEWVLIGERLESHEEYFLNISRAAKELSTARARSAIFIGKQNAECIRAHMRTCDVFILPSRSEACPVALVEALATGCICIVTSVGDMPAMLPPGVGLSVDPDPSSIRDAIEQIAQLAPPTRANWKERAIELAQRKHDAQTIAGQILDAYEKVIQP